MKESRMQAVIEASPAAILAVDEDDIVEIWNPAAERIFGWSAEEIIGEEIPIVPDDRWPEADALVDDLTKSGRIQGHESKRLRKDGTLVDVRISAAPIRNDDGEQVGVMNAYEDTTDQKEYERRLEAIVQNTWDTIYIKDREGRYRFMNRAAAEFAGTPVEEAAGKTDGDLFGEEAAASIRADDEHVMETGEPLVHELTLTVDGEDHIFHETLYPYRDDDGDIIGIMGISRDITERAQYQRQFEAIVQNTSDLIFIKDPDGTYRFMNEAAARFVNLTPEEAAGKRDVEIFDDDTAAEIRATDRHVMETGETITQDNHLELDGQEYVFLEKKYPYRDRDGNVIGVMAISRDITQRRESEREVYETNERLHSILTNAPVALVAADDTGTITFLEGTVVGEIPADLRPAVGDNLLSDDSGFGYILDTHVETDIGSALAGEPVTGVQQLGDLTFDVTFEPVVENGEVTGAIGIAFDVTDIVTREEALDALQKTSSGLLDAHSKVEAAEFIVDAAGGFLDDTCVALYRLDTDANVLAPVATTEGICQDVPPVEVGGTTNPIWSCYATGEPVELVDDVDLAVLNDSHDRGLVAPIGDHGVLLFLRNGTFAETTYRFVETLTATAETAFDRLETEQTLDDREAELVARSSQLAEQRHINDIIRKLSQSLIGATSQGEIERAVCSALVDDPDIEFTWIASADTIGSDIFPRTWAGAGDTYIDAILHEFDVDTTEPTVRTASEKAPTVVSNVIDHVQGADWPKRALDNGFRSIISVPLVVDDYAYGVLGVYASEADAFGDLHLDVFTELGQQIADAIVSVKTRNALFAGEWDELTLHFDEAPDFVSRLATAAHCRVEYAGLSTIATDQVRLFIRVPVDDVAVVDAQLAERNLIVAYQLIDESNDDALFEVTVTEEPLLSRLVKHGASPRNIVASHEGTELVVDVPSSTNVREFVSMLTDLDDTVELTARRSVDRTEPSTGVIAADLFDSLTERQLEVLRTAYFAGFYEWPRKSTGEDIADILDVSQPTVNRHLRLGTRRLLAQLFENVRPPVEAD